MNEFIGHIFIFIGLGLDIFGCIGLLRLVDVYTRLQASVKCVTLGTCSILLGNFIIKGFTTTGVKALLCITFLLLTAPTAAHALTRGAHKSGVKLWGKSVCDKYKEDRK
ncbi:MAG: monovalent cation/H(+) antiporter subunit G [Candidatus Omnitrophica bacterium]|nr:monovalent cation/H(+) antiporter subunit G [Candidatus Omnitrophota bacterium]